MQAATVCAAMTFRLCSALIAVTTRDGNCVVCCGCAIFASVATACAMILAETSR